MQENSNFSSQSSVLAGFPFLTFDEWQVLFSQEVKGDLAAFTTMLEGHTLQPFYTYDNQQAGSTTYDFSSVRFPTRWAPVADLSLTWGPPTLQRRVQMALAAGARELRLTAPTNDTVIHQFHISAGLASVVNHELPVSAWLTLTQAQAGPPVAKATQIVVNEPLMAAIVQGKPAAFSSAEITTQCNDNAWQIAICANTLYELGTGPALQLAIVIALAKVYTHDKPRLPLLLEHALGHDFLLDIARLRAQRLLMHKHLPEVAFKLYATSADVNKSKIDPNSNLLRLTTECLAGALGGTDGIALSAYDSLSADTDEGHRLALNIHQLLLHEVKIGQVMDPLRGTYLLEQLTAICVTQAEAWLAQIDAWGGIKAANESGKLQEAIRKSSIETQNDSRSDVG